ncbi:FlgO family outer membrane protein [Paraferrimonas sp. SM1919]|uniref:FlgO family outer membrane protein n=1 Tax=Paraferrimonas sp. SM1919 TaxID=2662263 RepID=UPI0013D45F3D|nr:FlgO family outer membrane protein [Paraferrimonas sp. SM1919]
MKLRLLAILPICLIGACSHTVPKQPLVEIAKPLEVKKQQPQQLSTEFAKELVQNLKLSCRSKDCFAPVIVTTPVSSQDLNSSNHFGLMLQQGLLSEMFAQGFDVIDINAAEQIQIGVNGERWLSRDWQLLSANVPQAQVLVTTMSRSQDALHLDLRLLDSQSKRVLASSSGLYTVDELANYIHQSRRVSLNNGVLERSASNSAELQFYGENNE